MHASAIRPLDDDSRALLRSGVLTPSLPSALVELVENALDAGATRVDAQVDPHAWSLRVDDNGGGVPFETLRQLGTTSRSRGGRSTAKVTAEPIRLAPETAFSQRPLLPHRPVGGRRGEALAAIGSLSLLHIVSRTGNSSHASEIIIRGGDLISTGRTHALAAFRSGTSVSVRDLFYNLPVRRSAHRNAHEDRALVECKEWIEQLAIANPSCAFKLRCSGTGHRSSRAHDERHVIAKIPSTNNPWATFCRLFGVQHQDTTIELAREGTSLVCHLGTSQSPRHLLYIDGRAAHKSSVAYKILRHARTGSASPTRGAALSQSPSRGRRTRAAVSCLVFVRLPPSRGRHDDDDARVIRLVEACVRQMRAVGEDGGASSASPILATKLIPSRPGQKQPLRNFSSSAFARITSRPTYDGTKLLLTGRDILDPERAFGAACSSGPSIIDCCEVPPFEAHSDPQRPPSVRSLSRETLQASVYIGQVDNKFLLCKTSTLSTDLFLVDQHAAHERVRVEQLFDELFGRRAGSVKLPRPVGVVLEAEPSQRQLAASLGDLEAWGFVCHVEDAAGRQVWLSAVPAALWERLAVDDDLTRLVLLSALESKATECQTSAEDVAPSWVQGMARCPSALLEVVQSIACRGAIMFGDPLAQGEAAALLVALAHKVFPMICAHGRPSVFPLPSLGGRMDEEAIDWNGL